MASIKGMAQHVWAQPVKVRVAVIIVLIFVLSIAVLVMSAAIADLGVLGALAVFGGIAFFASLFWALITITSSDL